MRGREGREALGSERVVEPAVGARDLSCGEPAVNCSGEGCAGRVSLPLNCKGEG